jgi:hypothetical protein
VTPRPIKQLACRAERLIRGQGFFYSASGIFRDRHRPFTAVNLLFLIIVKGSRSLMSFRYVVALALWFSLEIPAFSQQTSDVVKEETFRSLDANGKLTVSERTVSHESIANGSTDVVTEIYSSFVPGVALEFGGPLELTRRIHVTTTPMTDGGRLTITEIEERVPAVTSTKMHVVGRTVETVRRIAPEVWETRRQSFGLDGNGRLMLVGDETAVEK